MSVAVIRRAASGIRSLDWCVIDGPVQIRGALPRGGRTFPDRGDDRNLGACVAREFASARCVTRRFWTGVSAREHSCRERSAEAENALSPSRRRLVCSRKWSGLGIADSAVQDAGRRAKWSLPPKIIFLYSKNCVFENFRRFSVLSVVSFPMRRG